MTRAILTDYAKCLDLVRFPAEIILKLTSAGFWD